MKTVFKPLGIVAAVAAVSAGYVGVANAQQVASNNLGDLALVPYYTVNGDWITGIHIVNTSDKTQVVKFRFRRASDSLDALDFNVIMSPEDVYAGFLSDDENGNITWSANDTTCTSPLTPASGGITMSDIYRNGAETGYVEIIAMGQTVSESEPIANAAEHVNGVPRDCVGVNSSFLADGTSTANPGNDSLAGSYQQSGPGVVGGFNDFEDSDNALKVSYFIRDNASGVEFGNNAVHIRDFLSAPSVTNQEFGWLSGDLDGFDFPNLNGGGPAGMDQGKFEALRQQDVLGVLALINEWTANPSNGAQLDWVITMPGQYTMFDTPEYVASLAGPPAVCTLASGCDYRDIPVEATVTAWDREEFSPVALGGETVVSPSLPGAAQKTLLEKEVNVLTFGPGSVLGVVDNNIPSPPGDFGWLTMSLLSQSGAATPDVRVCDWDYAQNAVGDVGPRVSDAQLGLLQTCTTTSASGNVPVIGFAAWARSVAANPDASYGRIVEHSYVSSF